MKKEQVSTTQMKQKYDAFLFFVLVALIIVFAVVSVIQIRVAQFDKRMSSVEDSVTRIEDGMQEVIEAVRRYEWAHEEASDFSQQSDRGVEVGVGDRRATK